MRISGSAKINDHENDRKEQPKKNHKEPKAEMQQRTGHVGTISHPK